KQGGISFGVDFLQLRKLLMAVRSVVKKKTLIVKLSPNVTDIRIFARTAEDEGADAVSMINTVMAMSINVKTRKSRIAGMIGGLSGPAIRPVAVRMVWEVHNAVKIPIIGMGGIMTYEDALEFILAGATSVAVGTANFIDPISSLNIINGMREYMSINNVADIHDLIGGVNE
ncbi:MAG TPA: dihydroorotate dehydrogenase, partial [Nitrospirae bacterium]|nr:dihydroorotate dehydrogenase [Nitrospirota bacterium]